MIRRIISYQLSIIKHPLFSGSVVMIAGSNFANFVAYTYHLIIGRILGPSLYSELATVISLEAMLSSLFTFLGLVIVKFVASSKKNNLDSVFSWFTKKALIVGVFLMVVLVTGTPLLSSFLHMSPKILVLVGPISFFFLISFILRSFLQGILRFGKLVIISNVEFVARLALGLLFIYIGLSVFGTVLGILLGAVVGLILNVYFLKDHKFWGKETRFKDGKEVLKYTLPVFFAGIAINSFITTDIILAKHFFDATTAGLYAALATLGKIIFYGAAPVGSVMFPMVSQRAGNKRSSRKILLLSLFLTSLIAGGVLIIYWLFPKLSIQLLFGEKFLSTSSNLVWFGIFMFVFTISSLLISYYLALGRTKITVSALFFAILQIVGIIFFHETILSVIKVSLVSSTLLLTSLLIYFGYESSSFSNSPSLQGRENN